MGLGLLQEKHPQSSEPVCETVIYNSKEINVILTKVLICDYPQNGIKSLHLLIATDKEIFSPVVLNFKNILCFKSW